MDRDYFINLANILEGYKTRLKELHWSAPSHSIHLITDEFSSELDKFEDGIMENAIVSIDFIYPGDLNPKLPTVENFETLLEDLRGVLADIKRKAGDSIMWTGIINQVDDFFQTINKYIYLVRVCQHEAAKK